MVRQQTRDRVDAGQVNTSVCGRLRHVRRCPKNGTYPAAGRLLWATQQSPQMIWKSGTLDAEQGLSSLQMFTRARIE